MDVPFVRDYIHFKTTLSLDRQQCIVHSFFCHSQDQVAKAPPPGLPENLVNFPDPVPKPEVVGSQDSVLAM